MRDKTAIDHIVISLNQEGSVVCCKRIGSDEFLTSFQKLPMQIKESIHCMEMDTLKQIIEACNHDDRAK